MLSSTARQTPGAFAHPSRISRLFLLVIAGPLLIGACQTGPGGTGSMPSHGTVRPPRGFVSFCARTPGQCRETPQAPLKVVLTASRYREISRIHADVNRRVRYVSDRSQYGALDHWALPVGRGDCEDIALEKRSRLIALGYPRQALLLTLAKTPRGNGHLVLVVATDRGDFVLDNLSDDIVPWWALGYSWLAQQSRDRETRWVALRNLRFSPAPMPAPAPTSPSLQTGTARPARPPA